MLVCQAACLAGLVLSSPALFATQVKYHLAYKVTLTADVGAPFGEVSVVLETTREAAGETRRLKLIRIAVGGKTVDVPTKQFNSLAKPLLDTAQIQTSVGLDNRPELYVVIQVGKWGDDYKRDRRTVFFTYKNGKVVEPFITAPGY